INDIRDDLSASGIGVDVREDPAHFGRLQFYSTATGENSTVQVDPNDNEVLGANVSRADVMAAMGGIALGQSGTGASSSTNPNPFGGAGALGATGNLTAASFDLTLSGAPANNGTVTITLNKNIQNFSDLMADVRDELLASGIGVDVREDPVNAG